MSKIFEVYFDDLNEDAKNRYLKFQDCENDSDLNTDISPLFILEIE